MLGIYITTALFDLQLLIFITGDSPCVIQKLLYFVISLVLIESHDIVASISYLILY